VALGAARQRQRARTRFGWQRTLERREHGGLTRGGPPRRRSLAKFICALRPHLRQ
jgi:hypothetical protein